MDNYAYHPLCKVCNARNPAGKPIREEIDSMIAQGKKNVDCVEFLLQNGISVTERNFSRHLTKHSPFARKAKEIQSSTAIKIKHQFEQEQVEAKESLQKIIAMGNQMIDNWWNQQEDQPQLPITGKLFMDAIKEEGKRSPKTEIDIEFENFTRQAIEG